MFGGLEIKGTVPTVLERVEEKKRSVPSPEDCSLVLFLLLL